MKHHFKFIILILLSVYTFSKDCDTPVDCYTKSIALLQQDRAEMRRQLDEYQKKLQESEQKYENLLNQAKSDFEAKYQTCQNNLNAVTQQLTNSINEVRSAIPHQILYASSHTAGRVADCPNGFNAVSCSCGSGCGSWSLSGPRCNCQCGEWASAVCIRLP
jgi:hypothetical protein